MPAERVVARLRRHARVLILPAVLLIVVAGATTFTMGFTTETWQSLAIAGSAVVLVLFGCLLPFLGWLTRRTTITTRRIILRSGVFTRVRQEVLHSRGYEVSVRQNWVQSAFGSGDVRLEVGHEKPVVLRDLPRPHLVQSALHELADQAHGHATDRRRAEQSIIDGDTIVWGGR